MAKLDAETTKKLREALKNGTQLPPSVRLNFGDDEPFQKNDEPAPADDKKPDK